MDTHPPVSVLFAVRFDSEHLVSEQDPALPEWPPGRLDLQYLAGRLSVASPAFGAPVSIDDDLAALAWDACLRSAQALQAGQPYETRFDHAGVTWRLEPTGDGVKLIVRDQVLGPMPAAVLAGALLGCASRLGAALDRLAGDNGAVRAAGEAIVLKAAELSIRAG